MICSNCGIIVSEENRFCHNCGAPLMPAVPVRKGTHLIPILIMAVLAIAGTVLFFLAPAPKVSDTPWFEMWNGALVFYEDDYTGPAELQVPAVVDGRDVIHLGTECFADCDDLTTVILPDCLESVGRRAFADCDNLRGIFIPEQVTEIGPEAFADCESLEAVSIPGSVMYVYNDAFDDCDSLRFIFYQGTYDEWLAVFGSYTPETVTISCADGNYSQGRRVP